MSDVAEISEADVAAAVDSLFGAAGFRVERYEQARKSMIEEGLPDRRYVHDARGLRLWVELKRPGDAGQLTREQARWLQAELEAGGWATTIDDPFQAREFLALMAEPRVGRDRAVRAYCAQLTTMTLLRGYRREPKPDALRVRRRRHTP